MSWTSGAYGVAGDDVEHALREQFSANYPKPDEGVKEQFDICLDSVTEITESGALGDGPYNVSLSGHANQGEEDPTGHTVSISVSSPK